MKAIKLFRSYEEPCEDPQYSEVKAPKSAPQWCFLFTQQTDRKALTFLQVIEINLSSMVPHVSGPKRPQDRVAVSNMKADFQSCLDEKVSRTRTHAVDLVRPKRRLWLLTTDSLHLRWALKVSTFPRRSRRPASPSSTAVRSTSWCTARWSSPPSSAAPITAIRLSCWLQVGDLNDDMKHVQSVFVNLLHVGGASFKYF